MFKICGRSVALLSKQQKLTIETLLKEITKESKSHKY